MVQFIKGLFNVKKLMDMSESYGTYIILGALLLMAGMLLQNLGGFFAEDVFNAISGLLRYPGQALVVGGFLAAGIAGDLLPGSVRVTAVVMGSVLFTSFFSDSYTQFSLPF